MAFALMAFALMSLGISATQPICPRDQQYQGVLTG